MVLMITYFLIKKLLVILTLWSDNALADLDLTVSIFILSGRSHQRGPYMGGYERVWRFLLRRGATMFGEYNMTLLVIMKISWPT